MIKQIIEKTIKYIIKEIIKKGVKIKKIMWKIWFVSEREKYLLTLPLVV